MRRIYSDIYNMLKYVLSFLMLMSSAVAGAQDSIRIKIYPKYDSVSKVHRFLFGENYRKEYAAETTVPVIRISAFRGGLTPTQRGGGNQSHSLRLVDQRGKEWVLRTVEKFPEILLPEVFRKTFAGTAIKDNMSAQNPFSALVVPEIASAVGVQHTEPMIGWVAEDPKLGEFGPVFANTLCLLEEREPVGDTDNSLKMMKKLDEDNDYRLQGTELLKAKALDAFLGDWDRHEDQWRWKPEKGNDGKISYMPVPRDRDQVFYLSEGLVPKYAQSSWLLPMIQGYERKLQNIGWFFWEGRFIYGRWFAPVSEQEWDRTIAVFCAALTDDVLENALKKIPEPGYSLRHDRLMKQMKERRATLPQLMKGYYRFVNRIVDIRVSDKNELVRVRDTAGGALNVSIHKISKEGQVKEELFNRTFDPKITEELRLYLKDGNDSVVMDNKSSAIRLKIIGVEGRKAYHVEQAYRRVSIYDKGEQASFTGQDRMLNKHLDSDTSNTHFVPTDLYTRRMLLLNGGYNIDDKLLLGLSYKITQPGFRKLPIGSTHSFSFLRSFATSGYKFNYRAELFQVIGKADIVLQADAFAPENSQNFYGLGNETTFQNSKDFIRYYRARFSLYQTDAAIRWHLGKSTLSAGPSFQYYRYSRDDNDGRFINNSAALHSPDSATINYDKTYAGAIVNLVADTRNSAILPSSGIYADAKMTVYKGLNDFANSIAQFSASFAFHEALDQHKRLVLSNRTGGGITIGKQAFYQSQFIGGQGNLLGYREFRFGGQHSLYNNLEARFKLATFVNYILPGEFGLVGFHDVGRVWKTGEHSKVWHQGYGGGVYFAPASLVVIRALAGYSEDGWYPYIAMKIRY